MKIRNLSYIDYTKEEEKIISSCYKLIRKIELTKEEEDIIDNCCELLRQSANFFKDDTIIIRKGYVVANIKDINNALTTLNNLVLSGDSLQKYVEESEE